MTDESDLTRIDEDPTNDEGAFCLSDDFYDELRRQRNFDTESFEDLVDLAN